MFDLGFTMEELMFPENYQDDFLANIDKTDLFDEFEDFMSIDDPHQTLMIETNHSYAMKQLDVDVIPTSDILHLNVTDEQILPLLNPSSNTDYPPLTASMIVVDKQNDIRIGPHLSIKIIRDRNYASTSSAASLVTSPSVSLDQRLLITTPTTTARSQTNSSSTTSKSISSISFGIQPSTSTTNSTASDVSSNSNDFNHEMTLSSQSIGSSKDHHLHSHHLYRSKTLSSTTMDNTSRSLDRRRRKRTIFTAADIEHLKEAYAQNPKPTQQDIAVLSEQLGHDSYVIRVWFYNKRQASKKRLD